MEKKLITPQALKDVQYETLQAKINALNPEQKHMFYAMCTGTLVGAAIFKDQPQFLDSIMEALKRAETWK